MEYKRPESVLVVIYTETHKVLLMRRTKPAYFWQSVAGSLEWGETKESAAMRELGEETGLSADGISQCVMTTRFLIYPMWRDRYAPKVIENTEYVFTLCLKKELPIVLDTNEHSEFQWLTVNQAVQVVSSHTNRRMIQNLFITDNDSCLLE